MPGLYNNPTVVLFDNILCMCMHGSNEPVGRVFLLMNNLFTTFETISKNAKKFWLNIFLYFEKKNLKVLFTYK